MNNLIKNAYPLHNLWGYVRKIIDKYNCRYLVLPMIYLIIILLVVPSNKALVNTANVMKMDSYTVAILTKDEKVETILKRYNLTEQQFRVLCGVVLSEAEHNSYEDAYAVINTIYNRTHSKNWVRSVSANFGQDKGTSLYYQVIQPNQFTVYASGSYKKYMSDTESVGYEAIVDFLFTEKPMHNYLSFRSHYIKVNNSESYSKNGNNYFGELNDENRI